MSIDCLSLRLARSANVGLKLYILAGSHNAWMNKGPRVLRLVVAQSERVCSMVLPCLSPSLDTLEFLLGDSTWPLLTHMRIFIPPRDVLSPDIEHLFDLRPQRFPALDHLSLAGTLLPLHPQLIRTMKWLKLSPAHTPDPTLSLGDFFAEYSGTLPLQLKELIISQPYSGCSQHRNSFAHNLRFPHLRSLTIASRHPHETAPLLRAALSSVPVDVYIDVKWWDQFLPFSTTPDRRSIVEALFPTHKHFEDLQLPHVSSLVVGVAFHRNLLRITASHHPRQTPGSPARETKLFTLSVAVEDSLLAPLVAFYSLSDLLSDLPLLFRGAPLTTLYLLASHADASSAPVESWRTLLRGFPGLEALSVLGAADPVALFDALRVPPEDAAHGPLSAGLRELEIGDFEYEVPEDGDAVVAVQPRGSPELVAAMVECFGARRGAGVDPLPLLKLHLGWKVKEVVGVEYEEERWPKPVDPEPDLMEEAETAERTVEDVEDGGDVAVVMSRCEAQLKELVGKLEYKYFCHG
ncbi:uncharacterized protein BXZ73DRAFT_99009 [Epithele typhae]|uniref:uncharacterized protein n=1 Tax=Epithele typhae TaxID=378194 RepID=UPI002007596D|nr:uncharacterized protein BXZ73DRAFT_99009 [Epithele typhae]KAH9940013.1 hypothetical protein BXZ73DRAFT_99009 [Epithele typhae]